MGMHIRETLFVGGVPTRGMAGLPPTTGNVFFVDSGASDANDNTEWGKNTDQPFATIDYAVGRCTASNGDVIIVMPGHVETLTTAGDGSAGLALDVAGIYIIGLGNERNRPRIDMGTVAGTDIDVDAANITLDNVQIDMTLLAGGLTAAIDVNSADFTLKGCEIITADAAGEATLGVMITGDRCLIEDNTFRGTTDTGTTAQIDLDGTNDGLVIRGNTFLGACSAANIQANTAHTNVMIEGNHFQNYTAAAHAIEFTAAVTGTIRGNTCVTSLFANAIDPGSTACFQNYWYDSDLIASDLSGILVPEALSGGGAAAAADIVISGKFPPLGPTSSGSIFYVDSNNGASANGGTSPVDALVTVTAAIALCSADQGDIVYVMPDHTEVNDATSDPDYNIAGVTVIGLGNGVKRPEYTYSTGTGATLTISANNVRLVNYYFDCTGIASLANAVTVTGANVTIERCEFLQDGTNSCITSITTSAAFTRVKDCIISAPTAGAESAIENTGTAVGMIVEGCQVYGDFSEACLDASTLHTNCLIKGNVFSNVNSGSHAIQFDTAAITGVITDNKLVSNARVTALDPGSCSCHGNTWQDSDLTDNSAVLIPAIAPDYSAPKSLARGTVFYVDSNSGASGNTGFTPKDAMDLYATAIAAATANAGDTIYLLPNHAEAVVDATVVVPAKAGIRVVGLGDGTNRPTLTYTAAAGANVPCTTADCSFENILFISTAIAATAMVTVTAADVSFKDCEFRLGTGGTGAVLGITTGSDRTKVVDCVFRSPGVSATSAIEITGTPDGCVVEGCTITGDFAEACIDSAVAFTNILVRKNVLTNVQATDHAIQFDTGASTGYILDNDVSTDAYLTSIDPGSCIEAGNRFTPQGDIAKDLPSTMLPVPRGGEVGWNYIQNNLAFATGTTGTIATHEWFTVTGTVRCKFLIECTQAMNDADSNGTISFGHATDTDLFIADTLYDPELVAGALWYDATPAAVGVPDTPANALIEYIIPNGEDIGGEIKTTAAGETGTLRIHCWWTPLSDDGLVIAADGTSALV